VLDDIRLAVVDAFFSLPRGGAEIGGILLGRHERGRVTITDSAALECEHAFGPSFTLSKTDLARLEELLAPRKNSSTVPVGWYHSHTRSEIFLSDVDQEIHKRFFPEPWQVALVLKPHTLQPTRAGFFFREKDGSIHAAGSYHEFVLDPLPVRPAPAPGESFAPGNGESPGPMVVDGPVVDIRREPEATPASPSPAAAERESRPEKPSQPAPDGTPPGLLATPVAAPPARTWKWIGFLAAALGAGLAVGAYQTRDRWLPVAGTDSRSAAAPPAVTLTTIDHDGQLLISWDGTAPEILNSNGGILTIVDGGEPRRIPLDRTHLQTGSFTYGRQGDRVDLTLVVTQPKGPDLVEAATYVGRPPQPHPAAESSGLQKERDALAAENVRLKAELSRQEERVHRLEKALEDVRIARQRELQRKRMENQAPDVGKRPE
jgi:proteasome lid subunit RPN8/RPN11